MKCNPILIKHEIDSMLNSDKDYDKLIYEINWYSIYMNSIITNITYIMRNKMNKLDLVSGTNNKVVLVLDIFDFICKHKNIFVKYNKNNRMSKAIYDKLFEFIRDSDSTQELINKSKYYLEDIFNVNPF
jgi:hypothetical protein